MPLSKDIIFLRKLTVYIDQLLARTITKATQYLMDEIVAKSLRDLLNSEYIIRLTPG